MPATLRTSPIGLSFFTGRGRPLPPELRDSFPIDGTDGFAGNVLRYGAGLSYVAHQSCHASVRPVVEAVGWTVLDGRKTNVSEISEADGDSILNLKTGVRISFGHGDSLYGLGQSLYVGYGRALTGDVWYENILRAQFRLVF